MEALAMAGNMTVYGQRDEVKLIREDAQGQPPGYPAEPERCRHHRISSLLPPAE